MDILIVDDNEALRQVVDLSLRLSGLSSLHAGDGLEALELIQSGRDIGLILLDIDLPKMNGFEVLKRLKQDEATRDIPVIMLTGRNELNDKAQSLSLGAVDYLSKPFDLEEFRDCIQRVLSITAVR